MFHKLPTERCVSLELGTDRRIGSPKKKIYIYIFAKVLRDNSLEISAVSVLNKTQFNCVIIPNSCMCACMSRFSSVKVKKVGFYYNKCSFDELWSIS